MSLMLTAGSTDAVLAALNRSLAIAEEHGDTLDRLQRLGALQMLYIRMNHVEAILRYARRGIAVAATTEEPAAMSLARYMSGVSLYLTGDLGGARAELEAALRTPRCRRTGTVYLVMDHHNRASILLARTLWLQGYSAQAVERARETVADAAGMDNPMTLYIALIWAVPMFLWAGDFESAEEYTVRFVAHAETHSLGPYSAVGRGFTGALAIRRGQPSQGVEDLLGCLDELHTVRYELPTTTFSIELAQGLAAIDRSDEGLRLVDETMRCVTKNGDFLYMPELLRVKGGLHLSIARTLVGDAEVCFLQSLEHSRRQGARAWEVRTATDLAALWASRNRTDEARALLRPVLEQFVEGLDTADLKAAEHLLATLG